MLCTWWLHPVYLVGSILRTGPVPRRSS